MKKQLREIYLQTRSCVQDRKNKDKIIKDYIINLKEYQKSQSIMTYVSTPDEIDTRDIISQMFADKKRVLVPKIIGKGIMNVCEIMSIDELFPGKYGIDEPIDAVEFPIDKINLIIAPALCINRDGYRLGYGGGYYDRLLANVSCPVIGTCYSDCLADKLPVQAYDRRVDIIITEKGVLL